MSNPTVGRGGVYIFIENTSSLILGYVFWFVIAIISTSEVVGISAAVISMTGIFISLVTIGIPSGVQRFLGKYFAEQNLQEAKVFVKVSVFLICFGISICSIIILTFHEWVEKTFVINFDLVLMAILITSSTALSLLFRALVISTLRTKILPIVMITSTFFKIAITIILILMGIGVFGILIGFAMSQVLATIILGINIWTILKPSTEKSMLAFKNTSKNILSASVSNWFPSIIATIGTQLGTVIVFGAQGASNAGIFFIAFAVFSALSGIVSSLFTITYPALSSMTDNRKRLTWRVTKLSLIISLPFSAWLMFYAKNVLYLINQSYGEGSSALEVLLLSIFPMVVTSGVNILVYSYGKYRQVLIIGSVVSIPRIILYFALVPVYGIWGASVSYTIGSIAGLIVSVLVAKKIGMKIFWKQLVCLCVIPHVLAILLSYVNVNYIISFLSMPLITWFLLLKIGLITRADLQDSIGVLPNNIASRTLMIINRIAKKLNSSY